MLLIRFLMMGIGGRLPEVEPMPLLIGRTSVTAQKVRNANKREVFLLEVSWA